MESIIQKQIDEARHERLSSPLSYLVAHACCSKFHTVHDLVDFVDNEGDNSRFWAGNYLLHATQGTVSQSLDVGNLLL